MEEVNLKFFSDIPCEVYVDNDLMAVAKKNTLTKVPVRQGEYYVQLVSTVNSRYKIERVVSLDYDKPLTGADMSAYAGYPVHGSMALTQRGQAVLEKIEIEGVI